MPCYTRQKMSDDRMQTNAVINDKLLGTVVAYFRFGGIFNNQVKKCLLLSLPVIFFILVNVWHIYREKVNYVVSSVVARRHARDNHALACNFAKYSPI